MLVNCQFCGKEFTTYPSRLKDGRGKFCSVACYAKWQSENKRGENNPHWQGGKIAFVCEICRVEFEVFPSVADWNGSRFCSYTCAGIWRSQHLRGSNNPRWNGGQIMVTCIQCDAEFESPKCWIERGHSKFCSKKCEGRWRAENLTGEKAPGWQGGLSFEPYGPEFNERRKRYIRQRDDYTCAICGKKRVRPVHHIDYNKLNSHPENLIVLCRKCHARTNYNRRFYYTILAPIAQKREGIQNIILASKKTRMVKAKKPIALRRDHTVGMRISEQEKWIITKAAQKYGLTVSAMLYQVAMDVCQKAGIFPLPPSPPP